MSGEDTNARLEQRREALRRSKELRDGSEPIGVMAHPGPAERRNEPIREEFRAEVTGEQVEQFVRRRRDQRTVGTFDFPAHLKKPGWDYQWITIRVLGEPVDPARIRDFTFNGAWRPVPARDMRELVDINTPDDAAIEIEGQRLMHRPLHLTREAQQEDLDYAMEQQRSRMQAAASGQSAIRGSDALGDQRGVKRVPLSIEIETVAGV